MKEITIDGGVCHPDLCPDYSKCTDNCKPDICCPAAVFKILEPKEVPVKEITIALIISLLENYPDDADEADIALAKQAVTEFKAMLKEREK